MGRRAVEKQSHLGGCGERICREVTGGQNEVSSGGKNIVDRTALHFDRRGRFQNGFPHFLAGFELDDRPLGDGDVFARLVWVATDAGFANPDLKNAKIAQLHRFPRGDGLGDKVEGSLNHFQDFLLDQPRFFADPDYKITLCHKF